MAFSINTSLGTVIPHDFGQENGVFPIAECPVFDDINDGQGNRDWSQTAVIAEVSTKQFTFSFKQGRSLGVRYGLEMRDGLSTEHNINAYYAPSYIGFCAGYTDATQTEAKLYFVWTAPTQGEEQALGYMQLYDGADTSRCYGFTIGTFKQIDFPEEWDETPAEDEDNPDKTGAIGGEFADRDSFYDTDDILLQDMPTPDTYALDFGSLICCYSLHNTQLNKIGNALFLPNFWSSLKQKFEGLSDPLSFILDCTEIPLIMGGGIARFRVGGVLVEDSEGNTIGCGVNVARYRKYSFGSVTLKEVFGTAKDYSDTSISIFLPYVGVKEVDPDIVLNTTTTLIMYADMWNGDIVYLLHASNANMEKKYYRQENVVYRWSGNCGKKIPLGRIDTSNQILQAVSGLSSVAAGYAMGGLTGAIAMGAPFAQNVMAGNFKPTVQTSGGISGNSGRMDYQYAYYIIKRGVPEYPNNWRSEIGAPQYQMYNVSSLIGTGYTLFSNIQLGDMGNAIEEEKAELERLLTTEGVIL